MQDQAPCGRYYVKVLGGGSLTLTNARLASNWPLVVFVAGVPSTGSLTAVNTTFVLDTQGKGALHSKGTLSLTRSTVMGDVIARGTSAVFRGDTFSGSLLHVDTTSTTRLWDSAFPGVTTLELASDVAPPKSAPDFDLRNLTFNAALTAQLVFSGTQWAALTSVTLTRPGDWWAGMLTQNAHVTLYWWLTIQTVDGTGTRIEDQNTTVDLKRFNPTTLVWDPAPQCAVAPDECYFNTGGAWQVGVRKGVLLYRAIAEDRYGSLPPAVRATYRTDGYTFIENQARLPDQIVSALVTRDTTLTLTFSALTPDLTVVAVLFNGLNGVNVPLQPLARQLTLQATVRNLGQIITRNVSVYFYSTEVDLDRDGLMDNPHAFYVGAGFFIGASGPLNVNARGWANFTATWTPAITSDGSLTVSAVVDPLNAIRELNERNNTQTASVNLFAWPDLHFTGSPVTRATPAIQIVNNDVTLEVAVTNEGTNTATDADFGVYDTSNNLLSAVVTQNVLRGETATVVLVWRPTVAGLQTIRIRAIAAGAVFPGAFRNWDFDQTDNSADVPFTINAQPELTVSANGTAPSPFRGAPFVLNVIVHNAGGTPLAGVVISVCDRTQSAVCDQAAFGVWLGALYPATIPTGDRGFAIPTRVGLSGIGNQNLTVMVDANNTVNEQNENNNQAIIPIVVKPPTGSIFLDQPLPGRVFQPGDTISVSGHVIQTDGTPIPGVTLTITLLDPAGNAVAPTPITQDSGDPDGGFFAPVTVPSGPAGTYRILVATSSASVSPAAADITLNVPVSFFNTVFLGLPLWIWLIVIVGAAAAIGGGTAYVKFVGLGKLVECGECGSFIPEDSTKCPKCGVEFEKDMAKCSNCQAWIPVDVKQCPECGVEFATGEVEMADYQAQMRSQYEDVRRKFREEGARQIGRPLTDREFGDWWRTQPSFVTFEDSRRTRGERDLLPVQGPSRGPPASRCRRPRGSPSRRRP